MVMVFDSRMLSVFSMAVGFIGIAFSASLFSVNKLSFETMFWIMIGLVFFVVLMIYGEMRSEFKSVKLEQKKLDEKLKIYDRLAKLEEMMKNGS